MKMAALTSKKLGLIILKKIILFGVLMTLTFALTGCQKQNQSQTTKKISLNLQEGNPTTLNPYLGIDLRSRCLLLALYEPLMRIDREGKPELAAAESFEIDAAGTTYTFKIRPHLWSNGEPVTSYHFEKAWKYALRPESPFIRADLFYPIKNAKKIKCGLANEDEAGIFAPDEKTLIITLEHPVPYFLDLTASSLLAPLYDPSEKEPTCFNGPFLIKEWIHDQKLLLQKNSGYWDRDGVDIEEIQFFMVQNPMTALAMYENGEIDAIGAPFSSLPLDAIPELQQTGKLQSKVISRIFYLLLNNEVFPFQNCSFRRALGLSIDRKLLIEHLLYGEIPTYCPVPSTLSHLREEELEKSSAHALDYFHEALAEMHLDPKNLPKITFSYANLSGQKNLAEFLQDQWKRKLGIDIEIVSSDWNSHIANLRKGNYQIGTLHLTTLYQDPMFYFDLFRDKNSKSNYCRWEDPAFKALLEKIETTADQKEREQFLQEAEWMLFEKMAVISLFTQNLQYLVKEGVDLVILEVGVYDFKSSKIKV